MCYRRQADACFVLWERGNNGCLKHTIFGLKEVVEIEISKGFEIQYHISPNCNSDDSDTATKCTK